MAQFEKVSYQRVFNLGNYESVRIGADVLINPGEDAKQALNEAKEFVEQWRKENNAYHFTDQTPDIPVIPKEFKKDSMEVMPMEEQIQSCTSKAVLKAVYEKIVKGKPDLEQIYQAKLKELQ